jgi:uncharacterized protein (TIRG00374 family)
VNDKPPPSTDDRTAAAYLPVATDVERHARWVRWAFLIGFLVLAALFALADLRELWETLKRVEVALLAVPLLCMAASYATMARSYQDIARAAGYEISFREMLEITFVANTLNYLVATGGLSGFALRVYYFSRQSIPPNAAVVISLAQTFLTNSTLLLIVLAGFLSLFAAHELAGATLAILSVLLAAFFLAALVAVLLLARSRLRRRVLFVLAQSTYWLLHRLSPHRAPPRTHIWRFQFNLNRGIELLLSRKSKMVWPLFWILLDWVFTLLILHTAFLALRYPVPVTYTVIGFAVGMVTSFASLIPGGLGIMEGSMAAIFAGFGVPFETAVVAALLFRAAYHLTPLLISLFFLHGMFVAGRSEVRRFSP